MEKLKKSVQIALGLSAMIAGVFVARAAIILIIDEMIREGVLKVVR